MRVSVAGSAVCGSVLRAAGMHVSACGSSIWHISDFSYFLPERTCAGQCCGERVCAYAGQCHIDEPHICEFSYFLPERAYTHTSAYVSIRQHTSAYVC
jgi:hypothetical protein